MSEQKLDIAALREGLPEIIQELRRIITDPDVSHAWSPVLFAAVKRLAAIPSMLEEIERLEEEDSQHTNAAAGLAKENESLRVELGILSVANFRHQSENSSLRALITELREALKFARSIIGHPDDAGTQLIEAILTKTETTP